jgi:predicted PurR-regulated permease PerM
MELNKSNMKKIALLIAFGIAFYLGLKNIARISDLVSFIGRIFAPLLLGLALAFILNVLMRQVETVFFAPLNRRYTKRWPKARRPVSILVTFLIIIGIIALILLILVPELANTFKSLMKNVPTFFSQLQDSLMAIKVKYPAIGKYISNIDIDWSNVSNMVEQYGQKIASTLVNSTVTVATSIVNGIVTFILGLIFAIDILAQKETLRRQAKHVLYAYLPKKFTDKTIRLGNLTNRTFSNFIIGQCTEACILGTLCFIGMNIFRFPYAVLVSVLVTFMALIPIFGAFFSASIGALLILVVNPIKAFWFVVFFIVLQQLEGNLIYPRVVGSKVGLPALWVLAAITIGGNMFGLIGMLINIPLCSVLYILLREDVSKRLKSKFHRKPAAAEHEDTGND